MNVWREWLTFSKAEQRGFFILIVLCLTLLLVLIIGQCRSPRDGQIIIRQFNAMSNGKDSSPQFYDTLHVNTATVTEMSRFGFSDRLIINVLKYREAGGRYKHFSDFRKTYGFDSTRFADRISLFQFDFSQSAPKVSREFKIKSKVYSIHLYYSTPEEMAAAGCPIHLSDSILKYRNQYYLAGSIRVDSLIQMSEQQFALFIRSRIKASKVIVEDSLSSVPLIVDLNRADTAELMQIRGIGRYLAGRIIDYRRQLGGFVDAAQILEITGLDNNILVESEGIFSIDKSMVKTISINNTGVEQLRRHPYISFYLAKEIVERRRVKGDYTDLKQLAGLPSYEKASPYLHHYLSVEKK